MCTNLWTMYYCWDSSWGNAWKKALKHLLMSTSLLSICHLSVAFLSGRKEWKNIFASFQHELKWGRKWCYLLELEKYCDVLIKCSSRHQGESRKVWTTNTALYGHTLLTSLKVKCHIQMTPSEDHFNWHGGLKVPGCRTAMMRRQKGRSNPHLPNDIYPQ